MRVTVRIQGLNIHKTVGVDAVEVDGNTVGECLHALVRQFQELDRWVFYRRTKLRGGVSIFVNRQILNPPKLEEPINEGDEISLLFLAVGG